MARLPRSLLVLALAAVALVGAYGARRYWRRHQPWPEEVRVLSWSDFDRRLAESRGRPTLVVLWAAWCSDCKAELPELASTMKELGPRVAFVPVSIDESPEPMNKLFARGQRPSFDVARVAPADEDRIIAAVKKFGGNFTGSVPYNALLDKDGKLVREWTNGSAISKKELVAAATPLVAGVTPPPP